MSAGRRYYTQAEHDFIAANYATMSRAELGEALGRPEASIKLFIQRNKHIRKGTPKSCFKKGEKPWNAGVKGWVRKSSASDYKPGNVPHNATGYHDGMIVTRHKAGEPFPYRYRRLAKGKWVLSHRYNWEQLHGPIPNGFCLKCTTADTLNDAPSNWQLISRAALAEQNRIWQDNRAASRLTPAYLTATLTRGRPELRQAVRANPELLEVQRLKITLNRTLKS